MKDEIFVKGIETNNLKNIDVELCRNSINLLLGPSGSGKSSLAYDTIAQIGQHEYISMFADNISEPFYRVKSFGNMLPAVPIKQSNYNNNTRSTIDTYFGLNHKISLMFASLLEMPEDFFVLNKEENVCDCCHGSGTISILDKNKIINYTAPIKYIPFRCWNKYKDFYREIITDYCRDENIDINKSFNELKDFEKDKLLYGVSKKKYAVKYLKLKRIASRTSKYYGVMLEHPMMPNATIGEGFYSDVECEKCHGMKYSQDYLKYKVEGLSIGEFLVMDFNALLPYINKISKKIKNVQLEFAINKIHNFVEKAIELKLGHLYFNRSIPSLSGGELQRLRLVQVFNTQLSNLLIVLDEPLAGLSEIERPIIKRNVVELAKKNTLLIVDHGTDFIKYAKKVICLGEGSGIYGGYVVNTEKYILSQKVNPMFNAPKPINITTINIPNSIYKYSGAEIKYSEHQLNLISGESGVGKSTLLREYLPQVLDNYLYINQKPLLGNRNSSVITALELFVKITEIYGRKYKKDPKFFSNLTGNPGCCPACGGSGYLEYGLDTASHVRILCGECAGTGFNQKLRNFEINGKSIFDIWNMTIDESIDFFSGLDSKVLEQLKNASSVKLGHLKMGQATSTLSGGESIRVKMIKSSHSTAKIIGIDEPFKGLNNIEKDAVAKYLDVLANKGKTVLVIDHTEGIENYFSFHTIIKVTNGKIICT